VWCGSRRELCRELSCRVVSCSVVSYPSSVVHCLLPPRPRPLQRVWPHLILAVLYTRGPAALLALCHFVVLPSAWQLELHTWALAGSSILDAHSPVCELAPLVLRGVPRVICHLSSVIYYLSWQSLTSVREQSAELNCPRIPTRPACREQSASPYCVGARQADPPPFLCCHCYFGNNLTQARLATFLPLSGLGTTLHKVARLRRDPPEAQADTSKPASFWACVDQTIYMHSWLKQRGAHVISRMSRRYSNNLDCQHPLSRLHASFVLWLTRARSTLIRSDQIGPDQM
jgi:hypothetical protein